ncbi:sialate O-acetylesterase [Christiangramia fulva]|uniref:Sialate O-acetylesterase n=1 Tax=Christiangramia fulva TaxID=2126553 RepID=A0A2R3Z336_9FLAO|nr:sialate O-acetylesterase [Christiangramia fulva]AVR44648.1 sialate O-acetylesterase [Christiangramia fulva]
MKNLLLLFISICFFQISQAQVRLPRLVSDGMVLQRNSNVNVWGWASKGEPVSIHFLQKTYTTTADQNGDWSMTISGLKAGGPFEMNIKGKNEIVLKDIYVGDVWLASGQSNMELPMSRVEPRYEDEIATASNNELRFFEVPKTYDFNEVHQDLESGHWAPVSQENIRELSAVAYFFAKNLYPRYQIPIGIINSSLGGSPVESWISEEALKKFPAPYEEFQRFQNKSYRDSIAESDARRMHQWYEQLQEKDKGVREGWSNGTTKTNNWDTMKIPGYWASGLGNKNGSVWFQRQVEIPKDLEGEPVKLLLGRIVDADSVFVNGTYVGNTTYQYPPRRYQIPSGVLNAGENTFTIRVINESGQGGFVPDKPYKLVFPNREIDLKGPWKYQLGGAMPALQSPTFIRWKPVGLYNAMINPITPYTMKGVIWYQGESNTGNPGQYKELFTTMIKDWRQKFRQEDLPFLFVQLANFMESKDTPQDSNWARLREAQAQTLSVPNTGMAVTIDVGEWNDIHPLNKKAVGDRLAQAARKVAYNEDVVPGGPLYKSSRVSGDSIVISFNNTAEGLKTKGKTLQGFAIAGKDHEFVWATAEIQGDQVVVYSPEVKDPVAVRYGWDDNPDTANLYNSEGLPASPFRTDNW